MHLKPIDQQVAVVVGASSGIGRETALQFARRGARVVVAARHEPGLASLVDEIRAEGGEATAVVADVAHFDQVKALADQAVAVYGRIDTWAHLAAVAIYARFEETEPEEFKRLIEVNLLGQVYGAMAALPYLRQAGGGALIHVSSVESVISFPFHSAYASSKHGITGFVDVLRIELRQEGAPISVTNVLPASINTPFFNKALTRLGVKPTAPPPIYQPRVVADAILYAAEHPTRDIIVGGAGRFMVTGQKSAPRLMDAMIRMGGFGAQKTDEPKSETAPNNLFEPIGGYDRVEGDFSHLAFSRSLYTWFQKHPWIKRAALGSAVGLTALWTAGSGKQSS